jgi:hypothetical protein
MDAFPFSKLSESGSVTIALDEKSKAYVFDTGKSYFQSFELSTVRKDHKVVRIAGKELFELKKTGMTET